MKYIVIFKSRTRRQTEWKSGEISFDTLREARKAYKSKLLSFYKNRYLIAYEIALERHQAGSKPYCFFRDSLSSV